MHDEEQRADILPPELLDLILSHASPSTLQACALVCHRWLAPTRRHLFSAVLVRPRHTDEQYLGFLYFARARPHITVHIRSVELFGYEGPRSATDADSPVAFGCVSLGTLTRLAACLPGLRRLVLTDVTLLADSEAAPSGSGDPGDDETLLATDDLSHWQPPTRPFRISELSVAILGLGTPNSLTELLKIVTAFETDRILQLDLMFEESYLSANGTDSSTGNRVAPLRHRGLCLTSIHLGPSPTLVPVLMDQFVPGYLTYLHLGFQELCHTSHISLFMHAHGPHISEFTISFGNALGWLQQDPGDDGRRRRGTRSYWGAFRFDAMRNLGKLRFDLTDILLCSNREHDEHEYSDDEAESVPAFLACFPTNLPLQRGVEIDLKGASRAPFPEYPEKVTRPSEIEVALLRFENLARVCLDMGSSSGTVRRKGGIVHEGDADDNRIRRWSAAFPELRRRQFLTFRFDYDRCCS